MISRLFFRPNHFLRPLYQQICEFGKGRPFLHELIGHPFHPVDGMNPATPLTELEYILEDLDMVLLMTVNPGFGGQKYIESCTRKIQELRKMITDRGLETDIEVDGGIKLNNLQKVLDAGANIIVAGSAVFAGDISKNVRDFMKVLTEA